MLLLYKMIELYIEQSGAVEACWAHNPEVRGSKPRSARILFQYYYDRPIRDSSARLASKACAKLFESLHEYLETTFYELSSSILFSVVINIIVDFLYFTVLQGLGNKATYLLFHCLVQEQKCIDCWKLDFTNFPLKQYAVYSPPLNWNNSPCTALLYSTWTVLCVGTPSISSGDVCQITCLSSVPHAQAKKENMVILLNIVVQSICFLSVVVITHPSHGWGRRFDPGRKHIYFH